MNVETLLITLILLLAAFISSILISFLITTTNNTLNSKITTSLSSIPIFQQLSSSSNKIEDRRGDAKLINLYKTNIIPEIRDYYDILSASINKFSDDKILLTIDLAGDANQNKKYETVYLWLINYTDPLSDKEQFYTVLVPNFASDSNFKNKGWHLAIFNNTNNSYTLPLSKISDMPKNKVQVFIDLNFIGSPLFFNYIVSVMIRVNSTYVDKQPDYLVDSAPDNYDLFWLQWFSSSG